MCGLVGVAGRITSVHETAFKQLLIVDSLRGAHSVGIGHVNAQGVAGVVKRALLPHDFLDLKKVDDVFRQQNRCLIGHNRYATQGAINNDNAHPFMFKNVLGAHNGSLINTKLLPDNEYFEVDSEMIYNAIDTIGSEETVRKLHGAYALTWWNKRDHTLHFLRNDQRPLWYVFTDNREAVFWSSELWMLLGILNRNNIKYTDPVEVSVHREYKFEIPLQGPAQISNIRVVERDFFVPPVVTYNGYRGGSNSWDYDNRGGHRQSFGGGGYVGGVGAVNGNAGAGANPVKKPLPHLLSLAVGPSSPDQNLTTALLFRLKLKRLADAKLEGLSPTDVKLIH